MPISSDSDAWKDGEVLNTVEEGVVDVLSSNPNQVFRLRELADEVMNTDWKSAEQRTKDMEELDRDEFYEKYPRDENQPTLSTEQGPTDRLFLITRNLVQMEIIEERIVDVEAFDDIYRPEVDAVRAYTYTASIEN